MVRHIITGVTLAALAVLAGCGSAHAAGQSSTAAVTTSAAASTPAAPAAPVTPATSAAPATTAPTTKPLSFYAHQYETIVAPVNAAVDRAHALPTTDTDAQIEPYVKAYAAALHTSDVKLAEATWPNARVTADIRALINADTVLASDLTEPGGLADAAHDDGTENAAVTIVRADLGLPPVS